jgi:hypothetical protein
MNKHFREEAKEHYEKYKTLKRQFKKERKELRTKTQALECEIKANSDENIKINSLLEETKNEMNYFKTKAGIASNDEDLTALKEIIKSVKGIDIFVGLTSNEIDLLNELLDEEATFRENKNILIEDGEEYENYTSENGDNFEYVNGDEIISNIEDIVNDLFGNGKIVKLHIDQVNDSLYKFNGISALLLLSENQLKGIYAITLVREKDKETLFRDWCLNKFANKMTVKKPGKLFLT